MPIHNTKTETIYTNIFRPTFILLIFKFLSQVITWYLITELYVLSPLHNSQFISFSTATVFSPDGFTVHRNFNATLPPPISLPNGRPVPNVTVEFAVMILPYTDYATAATGCTNLDGGDKGWSLAPVPTADIQNQLAPDPSASNPETWTSALVQGGPSTLGNWYWSGPGRWRDTVFTIASTCQQTSCFWDVGSPNSAIASVGMRLKTNTKWDDNSLASKFAGMICHRSFCHLEIDCLYLIQDVAGGGARAKLLPYVPYINSVSGYYPACHCHSRRPWLGPGAEPTIVSDETTITFAVRTASRSLSTFISSTVSTSLSTSASSCLSLSNTDTPSASTTLIKTVTHPVSGSITKLVTLDHQLVLLHTY